MDYMIIKHENANILESMVLKYISKGWELLGGVSCGNGLYCQAIIKKGV